MPLLFATGAGAASRVSLGAAVVFGMAINTIFADRLYPQLLRMDANLPGEMAGQSLPIKLQLKPDAGL